VNIRFEVKLRRALEDPEEIQEISRATSGVSVDSIADAALRALDTEIDEEMFRVSQGAWLESRRRHAGY